jgi:hypothetical protein
MRPSPEEPANVEEPLVLVPVPALVSVLQALEEKKGAPLTEYEVWEAKQNAVCMAMPASHAVAFSQVRGYRDIDPENAWVEWQEIRATRT